MKPRTPLDAQGIDLKLLRLLDALHASQSVTRTAERLGLSQPTISIGLARLPRCSLLRCFRATFRSGLPTQTRLD